jgi:hypothetical protein
MQMAKCKKVMLKHSEIDYLLGVIEINERDGIYWGRKDYFEKRLADVKRKLTIAANTKAPE